MEIKNFFGVFCRATLVAGLLFTYGASADTEPGLAYKGILIQPGGYLTSDTIYRTNNTASDIGTAFARIPFANNAGYGMPEFRGSQRQSRFSLLAKGNFSETTKAEGYYELDFNGTSPTANANQSNSFTPRVRHVYFNMDFQESNLHILGGQTWSLATTNGKGITPRNEVTPPTIDPQYIVGFQWARQWQFRVTKNWDQKWWLALGLENAQTTNVSPTTTDSTYQLTVGNPADKAFNGAGQSMPTGVKFSYNQFPDIILKGALESDYGHYELYSVARNFQSRFGGTTVNAQTEKQSIWTAGLGGAAVVPIVSGFELSLSGLFGSGMARYGTSQLPDATLKGDYSLDPLPSAQYLAQLRWKNDQWSIYGAYGQESVGSSSNGVTTSYGYGDGGVSSLSGCNTLGGGCNPQIKKVDQITAGFWWSFYKGDAGLARFGMQYAHVDVNTYADANGYSPSTGIEMVYTSLRFTPF